MYGCESKTDIPQTRSEALTEGEPRSESSIESLPMNLMRYFCILLSVLMCSRILPVRLSASPMLRNAWELTEIGPDHRLYQREKDNPGSARAIVSEPTELLRMMEVETGMNYWDGAQWVASDASFDLNDQGFEASRLQFEVQLASQLNQPGAVLVVTRDGKELHSTPVAIGLYDAESGKSLIIGAVTNSIGVL